MGWRIADFSRPPVSSAGNRLEGLCDGTLDAAFVVAGHPNQAIGDLTGRCQARLIPIEGEQVDKLLKQHPYYDRSRIGANLYPGQTSGVNTFAVTAELVALASLPESEVRTLRDVLNERLKQFTRLHPALTTLTWEGMQAGSIALLHPGMLDAVPTLPADTLTASGAVATSGVLPTLPPASSAATPTDGTGTQEGTAPLEGSDTLPEQPAAATLSTSSGAASTNQAPALTEPPTPGSATLAPGHPLTPPEAPASSATPLEAPSPQAMPASPPSHAVGTTTPAGQ